MDVASKQQKTLKNVLRSTVDADVLDDLEEVLISSHVGVETTVKIIRSIEERVARDKYMNLRST